MNAVKHTLDKMGWSGWLVIERSRNKDEVRNVKKKLRDECRLSETDISTRKIR